jgi:hypothetical protein
VLTCTLFATVFSGYTAVDIPNEAYTKDFLANLESITIMLDAERKFL